MTVTTVETDAAPTVSLMTSAYGGWTYDHATGGRTRVTFEGPDADARCAAWIKSHLHLVIEPEDGPDGYPAIPDGFDATMDALFPTCEHGMSLRNCYGPEHFMSADQERALGF